MVGGLRDLVDWVRVTDLLEADVCVLLTVLVFSLAGGVGCSNDCRDVSVDVVQVVVDLTAVLTDINRESVNSVVAAIFQVEDGRIAHAHSRDRRWIVIKLDGCGHGSSTLRSRES